MVRTSIEMKKLGEVHDKYREVPDRVHNIAREFELAPANLFFMSTLAKSKKIQDLALLPRT